MQRSRLNQIIKEELDRALSEGPGGYRVPGVSASVPRGTTDAAGYALPSGRSHSAMGGPVSSAHRPSTQGPRWTLKNARAFSDAFESDADVGMRGTIDAGMQHGGDVSGTYSMENDGLNYTATVKLTFHGIDETASRTGSDLDPYEAVYRACIAAGLLDLRPRHYQRREFAP